MNGWLLFILFLIVGLGMLYGGMIYLRKEKDDLESVKIYRTMSMIGAVLTIEAIVMKFMI